MTRARRVTTTGATAKLVSLLDALEQGEEIVITRRGVVIAGLVPTCGPQWLKGRYAGRVTTLATDEELQQPVEPSAWKLD